MSSATIQAMKEGINNDKEKYDISLQKDSTMNLNNSSSNPIFSSNSIICRNKEQPLTKDEKEKENNAIM
jgi:hypothetical protein